MVGKTISRYKIQENIGMGEAYSSKETHTVSETKEAA